MMEIQLWLVGRLLLALCWQRSRLLLQCEPNGISIAAGSIFRVVLFWPLEFHDRIYTFKPVQASVSSVCECREVASSNTTSKILNHCSSFSLLSNTVVVVLLSFLLGKMWSFTPGPDRVKNRPGLRWLESPMRILSCGQTFRLKEHVIASLIASSGNNGLAGVEALWVGSTEDITRAPFDDTICFKHLAFESNGTTALLRDCFTTKILAISLSSSAFSLSVWLDLE